MFRFKLRFLNTKFPILPIKLHSLRIKKILDYHSYTLIKTLKYKLLYIKLAYANKLIK